MFNPTYIRERALIDWQKTLNSTKTERLDANLLGRTGLNPRILAFPLDAMRLIWEFLNIETISFCECLIMEALLRNYKGSQQDILEQPSELHKKLAGTIQEITQRLNTSLYEMAKKMSDQNPSLLQIVVRFSTNFQAKEEMANYLLNQLFGCILMCSVCHNKNDTRNLTKFNNAYLDGTQRLKFLQTYWAPWINSPQVSEEIKTKFNNGIQKAQIGFFVTYKPQHSLQNTPQPK